MVSNECSIGRPERDKGRCFLLQSSLYNLLCGSLRRYTHGGARQARIIRHTAWGGWLGWLADWQMAWVLVVLDLEGGSRTHTHTRCLDLAAYLDSHRGQASPVEEVGRGGGGAKQVLRDWC